MFAALQEPKSASFVGSETELRQEVAAVQERIIYHLVVFMSIICFCGEV